MHKATFELRQRFDKQILRIYSVHSWGWRGPYAPLIWNRKLLGGMEKFIERPPFDLAHCAIYHDHCEYEGSEDDGFVRMQARILNCDGMTIFLGDQPNDPPLDVTREILLSKDFADAVPWQSINFTGKRFEMHLHHTPRSLNRPQCNPEWVDVAGYSELISAVHRRLASGFGLKPDTNATQPNQLFHAPESWIVNAMANAHDLAARTRVETVAQRPTDSRSTWQWLLDTMAHDDRPPPKIKTEEEIAAEQEAALRRAMEAFSPPLIAPPSKG